MTGIRRMPAGVLREERSPSMARPCRNPRDPALRKRPSTEDMDVVDMAVQEKPESTSGGMSSVASGLGECPEAKTKPAPRREISRAPGDQPIGPR